MELFHLNGTNHEMGTPLRRPPVSNSTEEKKIKSDQMLFVQPRKERDCFKSYYMECTKICKRICCVMKPATDLVTLYLAHNLIAGSSFFREKCMKKHNRKDYNPRYFPPRPWPNNSTLESCLISCSFFQQSLEKAEKIFLK